jgi:universal stress protein E
VRQLKRILVAVKSPDAGWSAAIVKATQLARAAGAHVELFFGADAPLASKQCLPYTEMLERLAWEVREHDVSVSVVAHAEHPAHESILRQAESTRADLIVTDSHGGMHIAPSLLQLMDWELARLSPVPVLIVKQQRLYRRPKILAAVDPTHAYAKPLHLDARILGCGTKLCEILRGTLHAVHAYLPAPFSADTSTGQAAGAALRIDAIAAADARAEFNRVLQKTVIPSERRYLIAGHPADAIKQTVADIGVDIVVMGSMSRSGLRRLLVGNTADKLLYRLPCDLLLVKPEGILNVVARERCGARVVAAACS